LGRGAAIEAYRHLGEAGDLGDGAGVEDPAGAVAVEDNAADLAEDDAMILFREDATTDDNGGLAVQVVVDWRGDAGLAHTLQTASQHGGRGVAKAFQREAFRETGYVALIKIDATQDFRVERDERHGGAGLTSGRLLFFFEGLIDLVGDVRQDSDVLGNIEGEMERIAVEVVRSRWRGGDLRVLR
jgi:hypothetical protein